MHNLHIIKKRIAQFNERLASAYYTEAVPMNVEFTYADEPISIDSVSSRKFKPITVGTPWGKQWGSAWFRFTGQVPSSFKGSAIVALIDLDAEGCVFRNGVPWAGLTYKQTTNGFVQKRRVPIGTAKGGEKLEFLVEAAANMLFGARPAGSRSAEVDGFTLKQAEIVKFDRRVWQLLLDMEFLFDLAEALPEDSPRARKLYVGLNEVTNVWSDGKGLAAAEKITARLLKPRADASSMVVPSVGHAHIDLGWLWPIRETRRKGGRTFATVLRLMEEYPEYVFGASQPQLFEWVKTDYPALYQQMKKAIKAGRWECQGAMWVEPDMNIPSGEALVRQCLYGKRFYQDEFGIDVKNLWLPDVFGYSAALPQILKKCGVDVFMTQKISWNETNTFPHHTFIWEGIDGTQITSHFLPTNTYNFDNRPRQFVESEKRFAQSGELDGFLNLYGIGDGGGGPSRKHIEFALRAQNTEGLPRVQLRSAESFFETLRKIPASTLPVWRGELYLEFHRGTYTTQALMKKYNRLLEHMLHDVEFFSVLAARRPAELDEIWKETLLNQFHDILPGSSIGWVYRDAHAASEKNLALLEQFRTELLHDIVGAHDVRVVRPDAGPVPVKPGVYVVFNTLAWEREIVAAFEVPGKGSYEILDSDGASVPCSRDGKILRARMSVPSAGYAVFTVAATKAPEHSGDVTATEKRLENDIVRVTIANDGRITSIYRKDTRREYVADAANEFTLWEDLPYAYDAWDISHYYRETTPERARLVEKSVVSAGGVFGAVKLVFEIGKARIEEVLSLESGSPTVRADCRVVWNESKKHLRVGARTTIHAAQARYEIQFGTVERPTSMNTSWDEARFEVAAHRFADLTQPDAGFAIMNDCKYGHRIVGNEVELTLLKSAKHPDPDADMGEHTFTFAYMPHLGASDSDVVFRTAHELNAPVVTADATHPKHSSHSWFRVDGGRVKLETVKPSEDAKGIVLRLYETGGTNATVSVHVPERYTSGFEADLLENNGKQVKVKNGVLTATFGPYEIRTFKLV